jgi:hypothetical protein
MRKLGLAQAGGSYSYLKKHCDRLGLDRKAKRGQDWAKGQKLGSRGKEAALDEIFCMDSRYLGSSVSLKRRAAEKGNIRAVVKFAAKRPFGMGCQ